MGSILRYWGRKEGKDLKMNHEVAMMPIPKCVKWAFQSLDDKSEVTQITDNPSSGSPKLLTPFLETSSPLMPD